MAVCVRGGGIIFVVIVLDVPSSDIYDRVIID